MWFLNGPCPVPTLYTYTEQTYQHMKLKVKNIFLEILLKGNKCKKRPTPVVWANSLVVTHLEGVEDGGYVDVAETGEVGAAAMKTKKWKCVGTKAFLSSPALTLFYTRELRTADLHVMVPHHTDLPLYSKPVMVIKQVQYT